MPRMKKVQRMQWMQRMQRMQRMQKIKECKEWGVLFPEKSLFRPSYEVFLAKKSETFEIWTLEVFEIMMKKKCCFEKKMFSSF